MREREREREREQIRYGRQHLPGAYDFLWRGSDGGDRAMEFGEVKKQEEQRSITAIASDKTLGSVSVGFSI